MLRWPYKHHPVPSRRARPTPKQYILVKMEELSSSGDGLQLVVDHRLDTNTPA